MPLSSPCLSDKLIDWRLMELAGGQGLVVGKRILELGPSYGLDLQMWAPWCASYTMLESAPDVLEHCGRLAVAQRAEGREVTLLAHNIQNPFPFEPGTFDLVIDFGTIDNVLASYQPYFDSLRVLRPGGVLLSTYANFRFFKEPWSTCGDEQRFDPGDLATQLKEFGNVVVVTGEDQPRAGIAVVKR